MQKLVIGVVALFGFFVAGVLKCAEVFCAIYILKCIGAI